MTASAPLIGSVGSMGNAGAVIVVMKLGGEIIASDFGMDEESGLTPRVACAGSLTAVVKIMAGQTISIVGYGSQEIDTVNLQHNHSTRVADVFFGRDTKYTSFSAMFIREIPEEEDVGQPPPDDRGEICIPNIGS